ncbi:MAG: GNAT family N-acetyltransferase [Pseudoflavonifractor sp.]|nr:GNAT family N-acetyltransferase [Alloprevotella sp.]MCM1116061.1 GNAT family N-acetyltransferase [Pseudoflavonifractor sp.]
MSRKDEIKRLWTEAFDDTPEYVGMYFDRVYRETDAMSLADENGHVASSLLLQSYRINFHGIEVTASYIAGAATRRNMRGRGLMSALMLQALEASRERGDLLTLLIPASTYLYGYYARFGFSTVIYTDIERYTALHAFLPGESDTGNSIYTSVDNLFDTDVYEAMARMERHMDQSTLLHSQRDYLNILDDLSLDGGHCSAVRDEDGRVAAIAWGRPDPTTDGEVIRVDEVLSENESSRLAALRGLRERWSGKPMALHASVTDNGRKPTPRGMARIVNVAATLTALARAYPRLRLTVKVLDPLMPANSGIYAISDGESEAVDEAERIDLDVDTTTLAALLFSSEKIGRVTGLPSRRLHAALLLD